MKASVTLFGVLLSSAALGQGETCAMATPITVPGTYNANGPLSGNGYVGFACHDFPGTHADWYAYTPSFTGLVEINSCWGGAYTRLTVLTGTCGALQCLYTSDHDCISGPVTEDGGSMVEMIVTAGTTYYLMWDDRYSDDPFEWHLIECPQAAQGTTYIDLNSNGSRDTGEPVYPMVLLIEPGGDWFYSQGDPYNHCLSLGSYTITPPPALLNYTVVPPSRSFSLTLPGEVETGLDFALIPVQGQYDGMIDLWGQDGWIGNNTSLYIDLYNIGSMPITPHILLNLDPLTSFVSASIAPTSSSAQAAEWSLPVLQSTEHVQIQVTIFTSIAAVPNGPMVHSVLLTTDETDVNASNNNDNMHRIAVTAIDPNDKQVDETSITPDEVADQLPLEYEIRFQNTGTAPAVNIVVVDSLDGDLDLGTFQMIGTTHPYTLFMSNDILVWTFSNIMLADSTTNEPESHGSVHYRIAPRTSLGLGDQLTNRADIYFDYNDAVLTNTTVTTVELESGEDEVSIGQGMSVIPSPSTGMLSIQWASTMGAEVDLSVLDALGREVHRSMLAGLEQAQAVDLSALQSGTYLVRLSDGSRTVHARFVIQK